MSQYHFVSFDRLFTCTDAHVTFENEPMHLIEEWIAELYWHSGGYLYLRYSELIPN